MPFNIPNELISEEVYTGCPPGYILVDGACVHPLSETIVNVSEAAEYEFEYYEHAGELVGKYNIRQVGDPPAPPIYFSQNVDLVSPRKFKIENPSMNINKDEGILLFDILHKEIIGTSTVEIEQSVYSDDPDFNNSALFGEFHLLPNNPAAIKRVNLNFDLVQNGKSFYSWDNRVGNNSIPTCKQEETSPIVEWYMGYIRLPSLDRPDDMIYDPNTNERVTPTLLNPIYGTDRLDWKTLRHTCFSWIRIYDEYNLSNFFGNNLPRNGHYLIQIKAVINKERLTEFIESNTDVLGYQMDGDVRSQDYQLALYPPSFYMYPGDAVDTIDSPNLNSINSFLDDIVFPVPSNYKTDGNIHYQIEFLTAKNSDDILFRTSSYSGHEWSEGFHWYSSVDGEAWEFFTSNLPTFDNTFEELNGSDSERVKYIKYELSDNAKELLRDRADILFRIKQLDGTLVS